MTTFYFAEIQNANSYRKAEKLTATTLANAKREASKKQAYQGTVIEIATSINENGFITNSLATKQNGKWSDQ